MGADDPTEAEFAEAFKQMVDADADKDTIEPPAETEPEVADEQEEAFLRAVFGTDGAKAQAHRDLIESLHRGEGA